MLPLTQDELLKGKSFWETLDDPFPTWEQSKMSISSNLQDPTARPITHYPV